LRAEATSLARPSDRSRISGLAGLPGRSLGSSHSGRADDREPSVRTEHDQLALFEDENRRTDRDVTKRLDLIQFVHDVAVRTASVVDRMNGHQDAHDPRRRGASAWMMSR
jgi:hypothetical protein